MESNYVCLRMDLYGNLGNFFIKTGLVKRALLKEF